MLTQMGIRNIYAIAMIGKSWTKSLKNYASVNFKMIPKKKKSKPRRTEYWQTSSSPYASGILMITNRKYYINPKSNIICHIENNKYFQRKLYIVSGI